ncbi:MAG: alpha/beta hydrolase [Myxococcales bacterium]|nr:alpha/beta hydrolase [Myxococcales bacterium]
MPRASTNGIEIEYEVIGEGEPLVLIMGIGAQLIYWNDDFCRAIADRGFSVIRFDNRDVGLSTKLTGRAPPLPSMLSRWLIGLPIAAPYRLEDMAADTAGLLDALGHRRAHVVGASMGGMIAQTLAIRHPDKVASLCSIMSTPGSRRHSIPRPDALAALMQAAPTTADEAAERAEHFYRICGSKGLARDVGEIRERASRAFERCHYPAGFARHMAAILASGDRRRGLRALHKPTVVIHGSDDPLILPRAGRATAALVPGARLQIVRGMGHDLPRAAWPRIIDAIASNAARARC